MAEFPTNFTLFGGKLTSEMLDKWIDNRKKVGSGNGFNFELYKDLFEFVRKLIVYPKDYGFTSGGHNSNSLFDVLGRFFFPGLTLEDISFDENVTSMDKMMKVWDKKRRKVFYKDLETYYKAFWPWKGRHFGDPIPIPPAPLPQFRASTWKFTPYADITDEDVDKLTDEKFKTIHECNYSRTAEEFQVPLPGRNSLYPTGSRLWIMDIGAAIGYVFSVLPPQYYDQNGMKRENGQYSLQERFDSYFFPASLFYAAFLTALPFDFGMACVMMVRREEVVTQNPLLTDCLDGFFGSTITTISNDPYPMSLDDGNLNFKKDFKRSNGVLVNRTGADNNTQTVLPDLKADIAGRRFKLLLDSFSGLVGPNGIYQKYPQESPRKDWRFPAIWPTRELRQMTDAGNVVRTKLATDAGAYNPQKAASYYTPEDERTTQLLSRAANVKKLVDTAGVLIPDEMKADFQAIFEYHPLTNSREILSDKRTTDHYSFSNIFRSTSIRYSQVYMEGGHVDASVDIEQEAMEDGSIRAKERFQDPTSDISYEAEVTESSKSLSQFHKPVLPIPPLPGKNFVPDPDAPDQSKTLFWDIEPGVPAQTAQENLKTGILDALPRFHPDPQMLKLNPTFEGQPGPPSSAQHIVYRCTHVPMQTAQIYGHCAETYPLLYYSQIAQYAHANYDGGQSITAPLPLSGISIRPGSNLGKILSENKGENFKRKPFSIGRIPINPAATQQDLQVGNEIVVEDPCHNCKGLLRLFGNADDDLLKYDELIRPIRAKGITDYLIDATRPPMPTYIKYIEESQRSRMFYPLSLSSNPPNWTSPHVYEFKPVNWAPRKMRPRDAVKFRAQ